MSFSLTKYYIYSYNLLRTIILSPLALCLLIYLALLMAKTPDYLHSHHRWMIKQGIIIAFGTLSVILFWQQILIFMVDTIFLNLSNDFITAMAGTGIVAWLELVVIISGFRWINSRAKAGLGQIDEQKHFSYPIKK